jgi:hypothetical protein
MLRDIDHPYAHGNAVYDITFEFSPELVPGAGEGEQPSQKTEAVVGPYDLQYDRPYERMCLLYRCSPLPIKARAVCLPHIITLREYLCPIDCRDAVSSLRAVRTRKSPD